MQAINLGAAVVMAVVGAWTVGQAGTAAETSPAVQAVATVTGAPAVPAFVNLTLKMALDRYAAATGSRVERVLGVNARIALPAGATQAPEAVAAAIVQALAAQNVTLFPIGDKRVVAAWTDPGKAPATPTAAPSLSELLEQAPKAP